MPDTTQPTCANLGGVVHKSKSILQLEAQPARCCYYLLLPTWVLGAWVLGATQLPSNIPLGPHCLTLFPLFPSLLLPRIRTKCYLFSTGHQVLRAIPHLAWATCTESSVTGHLCSPTGVIYIDPPVILPGRTTYLTTWYRGTCAA